MLRFTEILCLSVFLVGGQFSVFADEDGPVEAPVPATASRTTILASPVRAIAAGGGIAVRQAGGISGIRKNVDPEDPKERFLVLTPGGPLVVEASIYVDGRPYGIAREELAAKQVKAADTDGDGKATWDEAAANPRFGFGRLSAYRQRKSQLKALLARYDHNQNGIVDVEEAHFLIAMLAGGGTAFSVEQARSSSPRPRVKALLDDNNDGILSAEEIDAAPRRLKTRDANNNDLLEASETGGGPQRTRYANPGFGVMTTRNRPDSNAFLLGPTADLTTIFTALKNKYGGADQAIQPEEFRWFPEMVTQLDLDKNGTLDSGELIGLHLIKPHVAVDVNLGEHEQRPAGIRIVAIAKELGDLDRFSKEFGVQIVIERPGMNLTLGAPRIISRFKQSYTRSAQSMLTRYDTDKNGYISKEEITKAAGANQQYLVSQFERWDADGDGMVFAKEIEASYLEQMAPQMTAVRATSTNQGPSLFKALDETGDNRLSLREMRIAPIRLAMFDKNADGKLGVEEMPVEIDITFTSGPVYYTNRGRAGRRTTRPVRPNITARTPKIPDWFTRMDSNGDGDLTLREFLGGEEKFKEIDTNSDGFIERGEAAAVAAE